MTADDQQAPKETGITKEYNTATGFEKRPMNKAAVIAELEKSFTFLCKSMSSTTDAQLNTAIDMFGQTSTTRALWISTATHLHEHLGQLIAYARSNKITPPGSKENRRGPRGTQRPQTLEEAKGAVSRPPERANRRTRASGIRARRAPGRSV